MFRCTGTARTKVATRKCSCLLLCVLICRLRMPLQSRQRARKYCTRSSREVGVSHSKPHSGTYTKPKLPKSSAKKRLNVDSPSFTPAAADMSNASGKNTNTPGLSPRAASAAPFQPKVAKSAGTFHHLDEVAQTSCYGTATLSQVTDLLSLRCKSQTLFYSSSFLHRSTVKLFLRRRKTSEKMLTCPALPMKL